ncbi:SecDF P1 head subdomain-containing protein [Streptomyces sp. NPDC085540]|uniref:SecDF P1 head subdomain-containing protein n=1 Tax=Streptomyces sp. NPDC085540 TaxID=3365730 RepID=UPI0037D012DB
MNALPTATLATGSQRARLASTAACIALAGTLLAACTNATPHSPEQNSKDRRTTGTGPRATVRLVPDRALGATELSGASDVLRQRAADLGLTGVQVTPDANGITVSADGDSADPLSRLADPAQLVLRPVVAFALSGVTMPPPARPSAQAGNGATAGATPSTTAAAASPAASPPSASPAPVPAPGDISGALPAGTVPSELQQQFDALDCRGATQRHDHQSSPGRPAVACGRAEEEHLWYKFALGPAAVDGSDITTAEAAFDNQRNAGWQVTLTFNDRGAKTFAALTGRLAAQQQPANQLAVVIDGTVVSHPSVSQAITGGAVVVSGSFSEQQARTLAAQLANAKLPATFRASEVDVPHS